MFRSAPRATGVADAAGVYLLALASSRTVTVQRGENAGSTLTYANVVRAITKIGDWNGAPVDACRPIFRRPISTAPIPTPSSCRRAGGRSLRPFSPRRAGPLASRGASRRLSRLQTM